MEINKRRAFSAFFKNKLGLVATAFIVLSIIIAIFAKLIIPDKSENANTQTLEIALKKPGYKAIFLIQPSTSPVLEQHCIGGDTILYKKNGINTNEYKIIHKTFLCGTDKFGRDVLSRLILGTKISLSVGLISVVLSILIGAFIGSIAGYYRGTIDKIIMWLINVIWAIPSVLLVIAISFALGRGYWQVFIAIGLTLWVDVARLVRGQVMSIKEKEYIDSARTIGMSSRRIIIKHIFPNLVGPLLVMSSSNFATAILLEAGLSFLGIGVQAPTPSWGNMIKESYSYMILGNPYLVLLPGIAIVLIVLAFMILGNALRDAFNVK